MMVGRSAYEICGAPPFLPFLSLSLFLSFSLFSLFLSSDLGTQFLLISGISLANLVPTDISLERLSLSTSTLASRIPADARFRPVHLLVGLRVGLVDEACSVVMVEPFVPSITHETALRVSSYELPKGQRRVANAAGVLPLFLLPTLLQGLPASPVAPRVQVAGHEGTNGHLGGLIVVIVVVESFIAIGSCWVHGSFPARPLANVGDVTVAGPQPAGVVEVPVLLEYFLSNPLQDLVATHPRRDGLQTDGLAAHVTLIKAPHRGLLAIARDGDEGGVPQGVPFAIPGHVLPCPSHHVRMILLREHYLDHVVGLGPLGFLLGDSFDPCFRQHEEQAGLLVTLIPILHVAAEEGVLPPEKKKGVKEVDAEETTPTTTTDAP